MVFGFCLTWPVTPSLPLPPRPVGQFGEVPAPTFSFHSGLTFDEVVGEDGGGAAAVGAMDDA